MTPPPDDHDCGWKKYAQEQTARITRLEARLAELEKQARGHRSEKRKGRKMPPPIPPESDPESAAKKRADARAARDGTIETENVPVPLPPEQCECPKCGNPDLRQVGFGKPSVVIEYVPGYFRRRVHWRETRSCRCGHIITANAPPRVGQKTRYASSFVAHLLVNKCRDSFPQYRLEKAYRTLGIPISRSTMCNLFHRGASELRPLYAAALALVPRAPDVNADETSFRQQGLPKRAFLWDFVTKELVVYRYATSRSGNTPREVLGDSTGRLVVDAYTGYNSVTKPGRRTRGGCNAHARRKIFEQQEHPETKEPLDLLSAIYKVERDAKRAGIAGTDAHLELRRSRSRPLFARYLCWARRHRRSFEPRSGMGRAVRYVLKNFRELGLFLRHATIDPDNNVAERHLRRVAQGRSSFLFVGNEEAGHNLAAVYTLVASCEMNSVNPIEYLTDVLTRLASHPANRIEELLPHRWKPTTPT